MKKLVEGIGNFKRGVHATQGDLFHRLATGQDPEVCFVTCADSRVVPSLITQTDPGDLFVIRNAGNIVPPHGASTSGEVASIEYAVRALKISDLIICGHSDCGAVKAVLGDGYSSLPPNIHRWLQHSETARELIRARDDLTDAEKTTLGVRINVLIQLDHLRTHPFVVAAIAERRLALHGWVFDIGSGDVLAFDDDAGDFVPIRSAVSATDGGAAIMSRFLAVNGGTPAPIPGQS